MRHHGSAAPPSRSHGPRSSTYRPSVAEDSAGHVSEKAERQAARDLVERYHRAELLALLGHIRHGFAQLDAGQIDEFDLDGLIHRYKKAAAKLWAFCGTGGSQLLQAARVLQSAETTGQPYRDWWEEAAPRR